MLTILDCYTDEPAGLGVPPYLGTYPRYLYGQLADESPTYITIDDLRFFVFYDGNEKKKEISKLSHSGRSRVVTFKQGGQTIRRLETTQEQRARSYIESTGEPFSTRPVSPYVEELQQKAEQERQQATEQRKIEQRAELEKLQAYREDLKKREIQPITVSKAPSLGSTPSIEGYPLQVGPRTKIAASSRLREEFTRLQAGEKEQQIQTLGEIALTGGPIGFGIFKALDYNIFGRRRANVREEISVRRTEAQRAIDESYRSTDLLFEGRQKEVGKEFENINRQRASLQNQINTGSITYEQALQKDTGFSKKQEELIKKEESIFQQRETLRARAKIDVPQQYGLIDKQFTSFNIGELLIPPALTGAQTIGGFFTKPSKLSSKELARQEFYTSPETLASGVGIGVSLLQPKVTQFVKTKALELKTRFQLKELSRSVFVETQPLRITTPAGTTVTREYPGITQVITKKGPIGEFFTVTKVQEVPGGFRYMKATRGELLGKEISIDTLSISKGTPGGKTFAIELSRTPGANFLTLDISKPLARGRLEIGTVLGQTKPFYVPAGDINIYGVAFGTKQVGRTKFIGPFKPGGGFVAVRPFEQLGEGTINIKTFGDIPDVAIQKGKNGFGFGKKGQLLLERPTTVLAISDAESYLPKLTSK